MKRRYPYDQQEVSASEIEPYNRRSKLSDL